MGTLQDDIFAFMIICSSVLLRMKIFPDKSCRENQNAKFSSGKFFFSFWKRCHFWDNVGKYGRVRRVTDDNIIRLIRLRAG